MATGGKSSTSGEATGLPGALAYTASAQSISDRRIASSRTELEIAVRNYATTPDTVRVEWYFVAQPVASSASGNREFIAKHDAQTVTIGGGKTEKQTVSSPEVQAVYERLTTITTAPVGYTLPNGATTLVTANNAQKGLTIRGWMVRLVAEGGSVLAVKASSQAYEDIAVNQAKLDGMLARPGR